MVVGFFEEVQFQKNNEQKKVDTRMHITRNTGTLILRRFIFVLNVLKNTQNLSGIQIFSFIGSNIISRKCKIIN